MKASWLTPPELARMIADYDRIVSIKFGPAVAGVKSASDPKQVMKRRRFKTLPKRALTPCRLLLEVRRARSTG